MSDHEQYDRDDLPTDQIDPVADGPYEAPVDPLAGVPNEAHEGADPADPSVAYAEQSAADSDPDDSQWSGEAQAVYGPSTVIAVLDQVEALVEEARAVPLSANVIINKAEVLDLVDQAREALPDDLVAANAVVEDADAVLGRADNAAESTVAEANARARATIDEAREKVDQMLAAAREQAERIVQRADEEADATMAQARSDAEATLADADRHAEELISQERVSVEANNRARQILNDAQATDHKLRGGADAYAASTLEEISGILTDLQRRADAGLRAIAQRQGRDRTDIDLDRD